MRSKRPFVPLCAASTPFLGSAIFITTSIHLPGLNHRRDCFYHEGHPVNQENQKQGKEGLRVCLRVLRGKF
jgi:hypothetical protein